MKNGTKVIICSRSTLIPFLANETWYQNHYLFFIITTSLTICPNEWVLKKTWNDSGTKLYLGRTVTCTNPKVVYPFSSNWFFCIGNADKVHYAFEWFKVQNLITSLNRTLRCFQLREVVQQLPKASLYLLSYRGTYYVCAGCSVTFTPHHRVPICRQSTTLDLSLLT